MKKNILKIGSVCLLSLCFTSVFAQGFRHPGALHTQEDFDRIKAQLAAGEARVKAGYNRLINNSYASSAYSPNPQGSIISGGTGENYAPAMRDAAAAYQNALRWKLDGSAAHADKAVEILNAWARTCKYIGGDSNFALGGGFYGYEFANAGELMRDYEGWKRDDFKRFQDWMRYVFFPANANFLIHRNGTDASGWPCHYPTNWGFVNVLSVMTIGILCDDPFIYNFGVQYYKYDLKNNHVNYVDPAAGTVARIYGFTEYLGNGVPVLYSEPTAPYGFIGQMQESGRDQGHAMLAVGLPVDICETAWNQGDDLYSWMDNRLAAGIEYQAAHGANELGLIDFTVPWTTFTFISARGQVQRQEEVSKGYTGDRPFWDRIIGHYEGIKGVAMNYSRLIRDKLDIDGGGGQYGTTGGGFNHLGFTTLTCTRPAVAQEMAPVVLKPVIVYDSKTYERGELNGITLGAEVTLSPQLPEGVTDNGSWHWESGETTRELSLVASGSRIYRVTYTHSNGVKSTQLFSIGVTGDWSGDRLTPVITVNGVEYTDTIVTLLPRTAFKLTLNSAVGFGKYKWNTGNTGSSVEINNISSERTYSVTHTDLGGAVRRVSFHIKLSLLAAALKVDDGALKETSTVYLNEGQSVVLAPKVQTGKDQGTWLWSDGSTASSLSLDKVSKSAAYQVKYTLEGTEYTLDYKIYVAVPDKQLAAGNYFIRDVSTGHYLTNAGTATPCFEAAIADADSISQMWAISKDGGRYKILSCKDGRYVNENARFGTNPYYTGWNTYTFYGLEGADFYSIRNGGSSGTDYWTSDGYVITGKGTVAMPDYPFEIIRMRELPTSAASPVSTMAIQVYPNPVSDYLFVTIGESPEKETVFDLFDLNGRLVKTARCVSGENRIVVTDLPEGMYIGMARMGKEQRGFKVLKK